VKSFRRGACLAFLLVAFVPRPGAAQEGGLGARAELTDIAFDGNATFPDDSLRLAIVNRRTECRTSFFRYVVPLCPLGVDLAVDRHYLLPRELIRDAVRLELYYWQRGYREAEVDTAVARPGPDEARVTFSIDEGRPIVVDSVIVSGDIPLDSPVLRRLPLRKGDPLSQILMDATKDSLTSRLRNRGYARAEVFRSFFIPRDSYDAEVQFDVYAGPLARFGPIDVRSAGREGSLSVESILRFLPFEEGDRYSREEVLRAQRSLFGVELIQSARIEEDTLAQGPDSIVPLTVSVSEGDVHRMGAGLGWSTAECFNAEARWTSRNFLGGARRLTVRSRVSNVFANRLNRTGCPQAGSDEFAKLDGVVSVELLQPWIFSSRNSLSVSVFGERASLPDIFVRRAVGANIGLTRNLGVGMPLTVSYRPQLSELTAAEVFFCTSFLVCAPSDIDRLQRPNWLAPVGVVLRRDRTDNFLNPSDGYQLLLDFEHASNLTGSNFEYERLVAEASWYDELARRTVVAARLRAGWIVGGEFTGEDLEGSAEIVHPQKRFYAGGASSVRGFPQNRLGPRVLTTDVQNLLGYRRLGDGVVERICEPASIVSGTCRPEGLEDGAFFPRPTGGSRLVEGNVEYRFAFGGEFQGVAFLDFGQVWREDESLDLSDLEFSPGIGVRYFSPVGPIRVDLGYRFREGERLPVITSQIRPAREGDLRADWICVAAYGAVGEQDASCRGDFARIPWVRLEELALLRDPVLYGRSPSFFQKLQLHISIGQAF
jgi:outer membrane protein insertion porin family/translocation and assembly module TamA